MSRGIKRQLKAAIELASADERDKLAHLKSGSETAKYQRGVASEGYDGGYLQALMDVELLLNGVYPDGRARYLWSRVRDRLLDRKTPA